MGELPGGKWLPLLGIVERAWAAKGVGQVQICWRFPEVAIVTVFREDGNYAQPGDAIDAVVAVGAAEHDVFVRQTSDESTGIVSWIVQKSDAARIEVHANFARRQPVEA